MPTSPEKRKDLPLGGENKGKKYWLETHTWEKGVRKKHLLTAAIICEQLWKSPKSWDSTKTCGSSLHQWYSYHPSIHPSREPSRGGMAESSRAGLDSFLPTKGTGPVLCEKGCSWSWAWYAEMCHFWYHFWVKWIYIHTCTNKETLPKVSEKSAKFGPIATIVLA